MTIGGFGLALANLEPEEPFDRLTRLAAFICAAPTALLTFVSQHTEHFKSATGLPAALAASRQISLDYSICQYAVATRKPLVVPDTRNDSVLRTNLAVIELGVARRPGGRRQRGVGSRVTTPRRFSRRDASW